MGYISRSVLRNYATQNMLLQEANLHKSANAAGADVVVFLSHSHNDTELVQAAENLLASAGVRIYVDWRDREMPDTTNRETAERIKEKIGLCQKFVVLASSNALTSLWVPWELGCADGKKRIDNIAILPVAEDSGRYDGTEYIQLYSTIQKLNNNYYVYNAGSVLASISLNNWLLRR